MKGDVKGNISPRARKRQVILPWASGPCFGLGDLGVRLRIVA
jgi:hypothetical protein